MKIILRNILPFTQFPQTISNLPSRLTIPYLFNLETVFLECAVFYTACAMKWVMQEVNKRTNNNMDPDQWAKPGDKPLEESVKLPEPDIPDEYEKENDWYFDIATFDIFKMSAMLVPIMALAITPMIISTVLKKVLTKTH